MDKTFKEELITISKEEYEHLLRLKEYINNWHDMDNIWKCPKCNTYNPEIYKCIKCNYSKY